MSDFITNRLKGYRDRAGQPFGDDDSGKGQGAGQETDRTGDLGPGWVGDRGGDGHSDDGGEGGGDTPKNHDTKTWETAPTEEIRDVKIPSVESRVQRILDFVDAVPPVGSRPSDWPKLSEEIRQVVMAILASFQVKGGLSVSQDSILAVIEQQIQELGELEG